MGVVIFWLTGFDLWCLKWSNITLPESTQNLKSQADTVSKQMYWCMWGDFPAGSQIGTCPPLLIRAMPWNATLVTVSSEAFPNSAFTREWLLGYQHCPFIVFCYVVHSWRHCKLPDLSYRFTDMDRTTSGVFTSDQRLTAIVTPWWAKLTWTNDQKWLI